jgi:hypothetical protein
VVETRYDGSSDNPFSTVKIDWTYDRTGKLICETRDAANTSGNFGIRESGDYSEFFVYDPAGNRTSKTRGWDANGNGLWDSGETVDSTTTYTYNWRDELLTETTSGVTITYTYDNDGNQISKSDGTDTQRTIFGICGGG